MDTVSFINNIIIPLVFSITFLMFIYGVFKYFIQSIASEYDRNKGKQFVIWSIVGFVLTVLIWAIINSFVSVCFTPSELPTALPTIPTL